MLRLNAVEMQWRCNAVAQKEKRRVESETLEFGSNAGLLLLIRGRRFYTGVSTRIGIQERVQDAPPPCKPEGQINGKVSHHARNSLNCGGSKKWGQGNVWY